MPDLAGADAEGQRAECAVGAGVAVAADDGHARLGDAHLRPHHVDDALHIGPSMSQRVMPKSSAVLAQRAHLGGGVAGPQRDVDIARGDGVVHGGEGLSGRRTGSPRSRSMAKACGEVTSWTRWASM